MLRPRIAPNWRGSTPGGRSRRRSAGRKHENPGMKIQGTAAIPAPRERVFKMLLDPEVLKRIIPGCETITVESDTSFRIAMAAGLASIRGKVEGTIQVEEERAPEHYRLSMSGKGMGSFVNGWANIDLADAAG